MDKNYLVKFGQRIRELRQNGLEITVDKLFENL